MKTILLSILVLHLNAAALDASKPRLGQLAIEQSSHVEPPKGTKTVTHVKKKSGGYVKGSPLYEKQEALAGKGSIKDEKRESASVHSAIKDNHEKLAQGVPIDGLNASQPVYKVSLFDRIAGVAVYAILVLVCAYFYWKRSVPPLGMRSKTDAPMDLPAWTHCGFANSICDCGNLGVDWPICLTAFCCPIIQWADTASRSVVPFMSYWPAIAFFLTMTILAPFTLGLSCIVMGAALVVRRRKLRKAYGQTPDETYSSSMVSDLCLVFCCPSWLCCQLVQEAREVEYSTALPVKPV